MFEHLGFIGFSYDYFSGELVGDFSFEHSAHFFLSKGDSSVLCFFL